jgi:hypothetical protein
MILPEEKDQSNCLPVKQEGKSARETLQGIDIGPGEQEDKR